MTEHKRSMIITDVQYSCLFFSVMYEHAKQQMPSVLAFFSVMWTLCR